MLVACRSLHSQVGDVVNVGSKKKKLAEKLAFLDVLICDEASSCSQTLHPARSRLLFD